MQTCWWPPSDHWSVQPTSPHLSGFVFYGCLESLTVLSALWLHHILSLIVYTFRENREFVFVSIVQFMMSANSRIRSGLQMVFVCLYITPSHYHHCANFIWRHWTYKMPVRYNLSSVWVQWIIFSQLSIIQYVGLCVFSLPISFVMIDWIYILCLIIIIKSEVWTITHCLGLGHETIACAVCLSIFLSDGICFLYLNNHACCSTSGLLKISIYISHISGISKTQPGCHFISEIIIIIHRLQYNIPINILNVIATLFQILYQWAKHICVILQQN